MSNVLMFERASASFAAGLAKRGHHIVYRANEFESLPGLRPVALVYRPGQRRMRLLWDGRSACRGLGAGRRAPRGKHRLAQRIAVGRPAPLPAHADEGPQAAAPDRRFADQLRASTTSPKAA